jgi:hypothetical protein
MKKIEIKTVRNKRDLNAFVKFPFELYRGNKFWTPPLIKDVKQTFTPNKNPAYEQAESKLFLAYKNQRVAGRIAGVLNHAANRKHRTKNIRFGWLDMIEDYAVAEALFDAIRQWALDKGMETVTGPQGFTNFDPVGVLIEGFDHPSSIHSTYNFPYYSDYIERYGFIKEVDYVEIKSKPPNGILDRRYLKIQKRFSKNNNIRIRHFTNKGKLVKMADPIFDLLNVEYEKIYGFVPLTPAYIEYVKRKFLSIINPDMVSVAVDSGGHVIGVLITMPSLTEAFKKANGRLLPFGWHHIMRGFKDSTVLDFLLIGVKEGYRKKGVPVLMLIDLAQRAMSLGFKEAESAPMLEHNLMVQSLHKYFDSFVHKRRRVYRIDISSSFDI